ncbi:hypothetical protein BDY24DRAFT_138534 [Mrakia frigida]|uniref:uncharacterized protein n=1 Tax=Mrakia frigida TaxID=29902 RepID=UPI003FCC1AFB
MGKPNLLRRRSKSSDGRPVSSLVSPSSASSSSPPSQPRQSSQGPPNFFYQDPTNRAYSSQPPPPSSFPVGPNSASSPSSSPSRNQFLSPHGFPQPPSQAPSSLRPSYPPLPPPTRPLFTGPPRTMALPGAPPLLAPRPPPSPSTLLLSPKTMTRSGGSSTSLSSDVSAGSGFSSFKDEEVEDLASDQEDEDFVLPGLGRKGGEGASSSSNVSLAPPPPLLSNLRSSSTGSSTTPATSVHSRDTSPHHHPTGPRLPSTPSSPSSKAAQLHGRTPSGSLISAAPLARTTSQQDSMRSKLPPLTTEFVPPPPPAPPKHDFFADTSREEESWEARGRRYEEAASAALMSPQSTYSQTSPPMVSRRITNGGGAAQGRSLWGADVDEQQPRSPVLLDLSLSSSFPSNGQPLEATSPAPLSPLPPPRNSARPVSSLRTSRPLGSPTKLAAQDQDRDHPLPPPPPRYTSPPPSQPQNHIYSPLTPTPNTNIASSSSVQAPFKQDYTSSASFNILPKITASSSTTFGDPSLMSHFGEDAFNSDDIPTISTLLSNPRVLRGILQELPIQSVLTLWEAGSKKERRAMDGGRYVREEVRVWGLGWAGYMRGGLDRAGAREGWANVSTGTILDFCEFRTPRLSTLVHSREDSDPFETRLSFLVGQYRPSPSHRTPSSHLTSSWPPPS